MTKCKSVQLTKKLSYPRWVTEFFFFTLVAKMRSVFTTAGGESGQKIPFAFNLMLIFSVFMQNGSVSCLFFEECGKIAA